MTTHYERTDQDWEAVFAPYTSPAKPVTTVPTAQAAPAPTTPPAPIPVVPVPAPSAAENHGPANPKIRTADEIIAAQLALDADAPEVTPAPKLFEPMPMPILNGVMGDPPALGKHQTTARTEVVELRREVAELRRGQADMARMVREIHARIVGGK